MEACTLEQQGSKYYSLEKCCTDVPLYTHTLRALWCVTDTPLCWEKCLSMPGNNILGVRVVPQEAAYFQISSTKGSWPWVLPAPQKAVVKSKTKPCRDNSQL